MNPPGFPRIPQDFPGFPRIPKDFRSKKKIMLCYRQSFRKAKFFIQTKGKYFGKKKYVRNGSNSVHTYLWETASK